VQCPKLLIPKGILELDNIRGIFRNPSAIVKHLLVKNIHFTRGNHGIYDATDHNLLCKNFYQLFILESQPIYRIRAMVNRGRLHCLRVVSIKGGVYEEDVSSCFLMFPALIKVEVSSYYTLPLTAFKDPPSDLRTLTVHAQLEQRSRRAVSWKQLTGLHLTSCYNLEDYSFLQQLCAVTALTLSCARSTDPSWIPMLRGIIAGLEYLDLSHFDGDMGIILQQLIADKVALKTLKLNHRNPVKLNPPRSLEDADIITFLDAYDAVHQLQVLELWGHERLTSRILDCDPEAKTPHGLIILQKIDLRGTNCHLPDPITSITPIAKVNKLAKLKYFARYQTPGFPQEVPQEMEINITYHRLLEPLSPVWDRPQDNVQQIRIILNCWNFDATLSAATTEETPPHFVSAHSPLQPRAAPPSAPNPAWASPDPEARRGRFRGHINTGYSLLSPESNVPDESRPVPPSIIARLLYNAQKSSTPTFSVVSITETCYQCDTDEPVPTTTYNPLQLPNSESGIFSTDHYRHYSD
jgi:hypothetical protein